MDSSSDGGDGDSRSGRVVVFLAVMVLVRGTCGNLRSEWDVVMEVVAVLADVVTVHK